MCQAPNQVLYGLSHWTLTLSLMIIYLHLHIKKMKPRVGSIRKSQKRWYPTCLLQHPHSTPSSYVHFYLLPQTSFMPAVGAPKCLLRNWHLGVSNVLSPQPACIAEHVCLSAPHQLAQSGFCSDQSCSSHMLQPELHSAHHRMSRMGPGTLWRCSPHWT